MNVFVTGGSGYIGRATINASVRQGIEVSALARNEAAAQVVGTGRQTGVRRPDRRGRVAGSGFAVRRRLHLGVSYGPDTAEVDRAAADALQDGAGDRPYVHTGGAWVYRHTDGVVDETTPLNLPRITAWRLENERCVLDRARTGGHPVVVMPGLVYGRSAGLVEAFFAEPARTSGAVPVIGDGSNHWAVVHVDDVAELYVLALRAKAARSTPGSATGTRRSSTSHWRSAARWAVPAHSRR